MSRVHLAYMVYPEDVEELVENMRPEDRREVELLSDLDVEAAVWQSVTSSEFVCVVRCEETGVVIALFGVCPQDSVNCVGSPWLLCTEAVKFFTRELLVLGREQVDEMAKMYGELRNFVHDKNALAKSLISRLGFTIGEPLYEVKGEAFCLFTRRASVCV